MYDDASLLTTDPPVAGVARVYFDAYPLEGSTLGSAGNPNSAALGSRMEPAGALTWNALLGVWEDCNADGYVGLAETAADEYRVELLSPGGACEGDARRVADGWVTELLWIGTDGSGINRLRDPRIFVDNEAMVWGDFGLPFPTAEHAPVHLCALAPLPPGTMHGTGGMLDHADCFAEGGLGAAYDESVGPRAGGSWRGTPMDVGTFGDDASDDSMVSLTDCSQPGPAAAYKPLVDSLAPAAVRPYLSRVLAVPHAPRAQPVVRPDGSVAGTVNETLEEWSALEDCDPGDDHGHDVYALEGDAHASASEGKNAADFTLNFTAQSRGNLPLGFPLRGPACGGVSAVEEATRAQGLCISTGWRADVTIVLPPRVVEGDATRGEVAPADAGFYTFYAHVGNATRGYGALPGGNGTYGAAFCPGAHGWECDAGAWYLNADGTPKDVAHPTHARPGQSYELRDVDCFDGTLIAGLPGYGGWGSRDCSTPA